MKIKGETEKIILHFLDINETIEIAPEDIMQFECEEIEEHLNLFSRFNELSADIIHLVLKKEADIFVNKGELKGNLFSVIKKNSIVYFDVYTTKEKYRIHPFLDVVSTDEAALNGEYLSSKKGYGEYCNLAQAYTDEEDLHLIISIDIANSAWGNDYD